MPKPVSIRPHYRDDAAFLIRLETAVSKDVRQTEEWRRETARQIRDLSVRLLSAKVAEEPAAPAKARAAR